MPTTGASGQWEPSQGPTRGVERQWRHGIRRSEAQHDISPLEQQHPVQVPAQLLRAVLHSSRDRRAVSRHVGTVLDDHAGTDHATRL